MRLAFVVLFHYFVSTYLGFKENFSMLATCMLPVIVYFMIWAIKVWRDPSQANFVNTMRMNLLASAWHQRGVLLRC